MSELLYNEARSLLCGDLMGRGSAREVFELRTNPEYVIKIEQKGGSFQNACEWEIWSFVRGDRLEKWFAPCEMISNCGVMLVQRKVQPLRRPELPKRLPEFLCDLKPENFGMFEGRFVCCDYGTMACAVRNTSQRLVPAKWRL